MLLPSLLFFDVSVVSLSLYLSLIPHCSTASIRREVPAKPGTEMARINFASMLSLFFHSHLLIWMEGSKWRRRRRWWKVLCEVAEKEVGR
jgi:hypothetical protein